MTAGELVAVTGPSGSGKSRLLHLMGTLDVPNGGTVRVTGLDAARMTDRELAALRASRVGFVFQQFFLAEHQSVLGNVANGLLVAVPRSRPARRSDHGHPSARSQTRARSTRVFGRRYRPWSLRRGGYGFRPRANRHGPLSGHRRQDAWYYVSHGSRRCREPGRADAAWLAALLRAGHAPRDRAVRV